MFRRPFRRPMISRTLRRSLRAEIPPALIRANELMANGDYLAAAQAYQQLGRGAQAQGIPHDAQLFLQASRCWFFAGKPETGMANLKVALSIIAGRGNWQRLYRVGQRAITELNQLGLSIQAGEIEKLLRHSLPPAFAPANVANPPSPRLLPTHCPSCGAPLHADEVEWSDPLTAECPFCGSSVRAEQ